MAKYNCQKCRKIWYGWGQDDICPDCGGKLEMEKKEEQRKTAGNLKGGGEKEGEKGVYN